MDVGVSDGRRAAGLVGWRIGEWLAAVRPVGTVLGVAQRSGSGSVGESGFFGCGFAVVRWGGRWADEAVGWEARVAVGGVGVRSSDRAGPGSHAEVADAPSCIDGVA